MSSVSASGVALPEGWAACIDPTHNVEYYFDLVNNCAQWEFPEAPAALAGGAAANVQGVPGPAAVVTPAASDFREAAHHEAAVEEQTPTAAEAAGAQAALGALLDADGEEELLQTAAAAAPYAKAFPAVAEALAAMGLAGHAEEEMVAEEEVEEEAEEEAEPAMAVRPSEEASQLFEVSFPEPAASPSRRSSWGLERDSTEGTEQGAVVQPLNWTREVKSFSSSELLANMAGAMGGKDSLNGMGSLGAGSVGAAVGQPPPSAPHTEAPAPTAPAPTAPAAQAAPSMAAPFQPAARPSPVTTPAPAEQGASPTTQIEILSGALRAQEAAQAAAHKAAAQEAAAQEALRSAEAAKAEPGPFELAAPPSPLKAARAARAARAAEAAEAAEAVEAGATHLGMGPAPHEAPPPLPPQAPWRGEATTPTALPPLPPSVAEGHARPTQTVPHVLADAEAQASAPSCEVASGTEAAACHSAAVQTEEVEGAEGAEGAEEEHTAALCQMRAQFVNVRRRCEGLELRLDGEAGVMLKAFRRHQHSLKALSRRHGALAEHARRGRATLALLALRAAQQGRLALCWHAWRIHASHACAQRSAPSPPAPAPAPAPAPVSEPAPAPPAAPRIERQELYRMSYEALIDKVLELQESLHAGRGVATSGGGGSAAAAEGEAANAGAPGRGAQPPVAETSAKAKGKKKK